MISVDDCRSKQPDRVSGRCTQRQSLLFFGNLSIFLHNVAIAGALERARTVGILHAFAATFPEANQELIWHPNTQGVAAP